MTALARPAPPLVLSRSDVLALLSLPECVEAVERAFRLHAEGRTPAPGVLGIHAAGGGFHIRAAGLAGEPGYFAAKTNANFPGNARRGLPTIQGTVLLADASHGLPLAIMDSGSLTALRTAAATAVAARHLARPDARIPTLVGCGVQGEVQLAALAAVRPLERARVPGGGRDAGAAGADPLVLHQGGRLRVRQRPGDRAVPLRRRRAGVSLAHR